MTLHLAFNPRDGHLELSDDDVHLVLSDDQVRALDEFLHAHYGPPRDPNPPDELEEP